ncbi:MAG: FtsW/RodA/SpoVE family cell cycle protein [Tissierellaceae bacterium]|jgi:cell division protein FtsW (lipid II flippase)|nr:FtsW/RodA/SpoVE family cell cycle protein [Tissierellia bacterium]
MLSRGISGRTPRRLLFLYEILALSLLFVYQIDKLDKYILATGMGLILLVYISNYLLLKISKGDNYIFLIATMLMSVGIIMIYRISPVAGIRQLMWLSLGIFLFYLTYFITKHFKSLDRLLYLYIGGAYFLFLITFLFGERTYGAINWIKVAGFSFQPAEMTKLILIFILATYYSRYDKYKEVKYSSYILTIIVFSFIGLLFLQRDLGMAVIFFGIFIILQFIFEEDRRLIYINLGLILVGGLIAYRLFSHVRIRVDIWIDPWRFIDDKGYQITQSLFAIAEGGFFGKGLGLGHPQFIPLAYNDFIFAAICEELGIFTGIGIIMLFLLLVYRGFKIGISQVNRFYKILALGISSLFGIQSFIILGGVLKVIPLTGITLPFVAYGGTSIISSFMALGILQTASEDMEWRMDHE